jgi:hypothetical protein
MKTTVKKMQTISIATIMLFLFQPVNAQFLKKLSNRVQQTVENVIIEKTADKAGEKTSNSMDKVLNMKIPGMGGKQVDASEIPNSYDFTWKYSLKMNTKEGDMVLDYFLKPDQPYFGFNTPTMEDMFMVMDTGNKLTVIYMQSEANSTMMAMAMPDDINIEEMEDTSEDFTYDILPNKTIMGFDCKGVKATNDRYDMTMYFTNEAPVSFNDIYKSDKAQIPEGMKKYFKDGENTLMLELTMIDKKKSKLNATMECIGLEEVQKMIDKSDYKSMTNPAIGGD